MKGHLGPTSRGESQYVYPEKETPGSEEGRDAPDGQGSASVEGTGQRANGPTSVPPGKGVTPTLTDPSPRQRKYSGSEIHAQNTHTENRTWDSCKLIRKTQKPPQKMGGSKRKLRHIWPRACARQSFPQHRPPPSPPALPG